VGNDLKPFRVRPPREFCEALVSDSSQHCRERARRWLDTVVRTRLKDGPGFVVLNGLPADLETGTTISRRVSELLGSIVPQDKEKTLVRQVRDRGSSIGGEGRVRYADSRFGGNFHTDGAEAPPPVPDLFTLLCLRQAPIGGALRLIHIREVLASLSAFPDVIAVLRGPFHFDRRGDQGAGEKPTVVKPILFEHQGHTGITYLRRYIELGHSHPGVPPLSGAERRALDLLDGAMDDPAVGVVGRLQPGDLAIVNNVVVLHGRTEFRESPDPRTSRLLLRTWIRTNTADDR
jgi:hypothetical protein